MKVVGSTSCGKLPKVFSGNKEAIQFHIHDFANRNQKRGKCICTDNIRVQGYLWSLVIYPRGHSESKTDAEYVSFYLRCEVENSISNPVVAMTDIRTKTKSTTLGKVSYSKGSYRGWHNFSKRQDIIQNDCTQEGTLTVTVELEIATEKNAVWFPRQLTCDNYDQLYRSVETTSDVTFVVGNVGKEFMAHKCILALRARELYELVIVEEELSNNNNDDDEGRSSGIFIVLPDIDEKVFKLFLEFLYTGKEPELDKNDEDDGEIVKLILDAANRFSCTYLKLYIESVIVEEFLVPSNAAALLLLADSYSCALLKEASMNMFVIDPLAVMESKDDWTKLKESNDLLEELLVYTNNPGGRKIYSSVVENGDGTLDDVDDFDVTSLRERLEKANIDVDGSRQILVERWKRYLRHTDAGGQYSLGTGGNTSNRGRTPATGWRRILRARTAQPVGISDPLPVGDSAPAPGMGGLWRLIPSFRMVCLLCFFAGLCSSWRPV